MRGPQGRISRNSLLEIGNTKGYVWHQTQAKTANGKQRITFRKTQVLGLGQILKSKLQNFTTPINTLNQGDTAQHQAPAFY